MKNIENLARSRASIIARALADHARSQWGIDAEVAGEGVRLSARRLRSRMADDPAMRWIGGWLK